MRASVGLVLSAGLLASCGSSEQSAIEAMVVDRMGPVTSVSDAVIYREGDQKKSCVVVTYENNWGEAMPPVFIIGWVGFQSGRWHTDNPHEIDGYFDCAEFAAGRGQILEG